MRTDQTWVFENSAEVSIIAPVRNVDLRVGFASNNIVNDRCLMNFISKGRPTSKLYSLYISGPCFYEANFI